MRDPRDKFKPVQNVDAAAGLKIASPDLEGVLPGSTLYVASNESDVAKYTRLIESEMKSVFIDTETNGVVLKCDTIGSLEAIVEMLRRSQVPIAKADIGPVNRRDLMEAKAIKENDRHLGVILAFNIKILPDAKDESEDCHIKILEDKIIYSLIDNYNAWVSEDTANEEDAVFAEITPISKFTFLKGYVFRNTDPAVFGIRIDVGTLKQKVPFMNMDGRRIGLVHQRQLDKKTVSRNTILLFCGCFLLTSQPALGATIQEFLPGLLDSHQRIKAAQEKTRSAEYLVRQHRAGYLPSVDFLSETGYEDIHKENGPDTDYGDKTYNRLRAAQLLWDFGATAGMVDKTENFLQQVTFEETDTRQEVLLEGILACVDIIRERDRLSYAKRSEDNMKKQTGIEETMLEKGAGIRSDVLQAQSHLAKTFSLAPPASSRRLLAAQKGPIAAATSAGSAIRPHGRSSSITPVRTS